MSHRPLAPSRRADGTADRGFTLIELLLVVVLLGVISIAVAGALWFGIRSTQDNATLLDQSMSAQAVNRYLAADIMAAEGVTTAATCGTADLKLTSRSDATSTGATDVVTAWQWTSGTTTLVRRVCLNGTTQSTRTLARNIDQFTVTANADKSYSVTYRAAGKGRISSVTRTLKVEPVAAREVP